MKRLLVCLLGFIGIAADAGPVQPIASNAIVDKFRSLSPDNQRLTGVLASRLRANSEGFLEHADPPQLLAAYVKDHRKTEGSETAGRYLQAAANAYNYRQDSELRKIMDSVANGLADAQESDGYLGIYAGSDRAAAPDLAVQRANLMGLLAYYEATGEERAYTAAQKMGDYLVKRLQSNNPRNKVELPTGDIEIKLAAAGLAEPLAELYRYTAEPAYVDLAKGIFSIADLPSQFSHDASQASSDLQTAWLHAFSGMADLYRITGDATYLQNAVHGWETFDRAAGDSENSNCFASSWLRLSLTLFNITGQEQFGGQLEKTIYNQLMAGQNVANGDVCANMPMAGKKHFLPRSGAMVSNCALAESLGISLIPQAVWGRWTSGIAVNLYSAGRGTFQLRHRALVQIYSEASYPEHGEILLHVEPSRRARFPLRLRVPEWAQTFSVDFAGSHLLGKAGQPLVIDRQWQRGDTVKVTIAMQVQTVSGKGARSGQLALQRGPQMLVLDRALNPQVKDLNQAVPLLSESSRPQLESLENKMPRNWSGEEAYQMTGQYEGKQTTLTLVPFADAFDFAMWFKSNRAVPDTE